MKTSSAFFFSLALLAVSCGPSPQQKVETLQQEVMALHDSTMAKMGALYNGRKALTYLKDSVVAQDSATQQPLRRQIEALVASDEGMMQWMRAYRNPEGKKPEEALVYLQQEKEKIDQVRIAIDQSLRAADSLVDVYRTQKP